MTDKDLPAVREIAAQVADLTPDQRYKALRAIAEETIRVVAGGKDNPHARHAAKLIYERFETALSAACTRAAPDGETNREAFELGLLRFVNEQEA